MSTIDGTTAVAGSGRQALLHACKDKRFAMTPERPPEEPLCPAIRDWTAGAGAPATQDDDKEFWAGGGGRRGDSAVPAVLHCRPGDAVDGSGFVVHKSFAGGLESLEGLERGRLIRESRFPSQFPHHQLDLVRMAGLDQPPACGAPSCLIRALRACQFQAGSCMRFLFPICSFLANLRPWRTNPPLPLRRSTSSRLVRLPGNTRNCGDRAGPTANHGQQRLPFSGRRIVPGRRTWWSGKCVG